MSPDLMSPVFDRPKSLKSIRFVHFYKLKSTIKNENSSILQMTKNIKTLIYDI